MDNVNKKQRCVYCGGYNGEKPRGEVWVECCSCCNELQYVGRCKVCEGTGFVINSIHSNLKMINDLARATGGYLCGLNPNSGY